MITVLFFHSGILDIILYKKKRKPTQWDGAVEAIVNDSHLKEIRV